MIDIPIPKYKIGDIVWADLGYYGETKVVCPDCLGKQEWDVKTPAGESFKLGCGTCEQGWNNSVGYIAKYGPVAKVSRLTVGSVRTDTASKDEPISYMCVETGIGSGVVYRENQLYFLESEALAAANKSAIEHTKYITEQNEQRLTNNKKKTKKKPTLIEWMSKRIKELESQLATFQKL